jgi:site-specific DNA recombinase
MNKKTYPQIYENGKKAIIYLRVSTEEQVDNFSLDTQEDICRKEAQKRGYEIIDIFKEEGRSAKNISGRPILINLLEYCRKRKNQLQAVFVYRLDRISRQTSDYLAIRKKLAENDVTIISATEPTGDSPTEKLVETILAGFAQLDNDIRSERAKNGLRARFLSGLISGKAPLGYTFKGGFAVKDPKTWDAVKTAWDLMAVGKTSLSQIAEFMNKQGLQIHHGKKAFNIRPQTANRIFRLKFYAGILTSNTYPEEVRGQHLPMITIEQYYKVQAALDGRKVNNLAVVRRFRANEDFPLRRIVKCGVCNIGLTGGWSRGRNARYPYYRCAGKCTKSIKVEMLENSMIDLLKTVTPSVECVELFITWMHKTYHQRFSRLQKLRDEADDELQQLLLTRRKLVEKNLSGVYSDEIFREQSSIIEDKITKVQITKEDALFDKYNLEKITDFIRTMLADLSETYKRSDLDQTKVLLGSVFPSGLAWSDKGRLNHEISPIYKYIQTINSETIPSGAGNGARTRDLLLGKQTLYH